MWIESNPSTGEHCAIKFNIHLELEASTIQLHCERATICNNKLFVKMEIGVTNTKLSIRGVKHHASCAACGNSIDADFRRVATDLR